MENPWTRLPKQPPYVLPEDRDAVLAANASLNEVERREYGYQLQLLPDPFIGDLNAPFVMIYLNPGYTPPATNGTFNDDWWHANSIALQDAYRNNFAQRPLRYPFFFLDPAFRNSPGGEYWNRHLRELLNYCDQGQLANNLLVMDYFPYHSKSYKMLCTVPSQKFVIEHLRSAMERGAEILLMRSESALRKAVPQLAEYDYLRANSAQSGYVTRNNVPGFDRIIKAVRGRAA